MKISKRSVEQHCPAYAKHSARLKAIKCMIFLHFPSMLIALEAMSSGLLFANQFEDFNYYIWNWDTDSNSKANSPLHYMWHPMLIHQYAGYQIAFQYYSHSVSYWKSETSISSRHTTTSKIWSVRLQYIWFRGDIDKYGRDWYRRVPNSARKAVDHRAIYATRSCSAAAAPKHAETPKD